MTEQMPVTRGGWRLWLIKDRKNNDESRPAQAKRLQVGERVIRDIETVPTRSIRIGTVLQLTQAWVQNQGSSS